MDLNELKIDTTKVEEGAWVDNIPDMGALRLKVRGMGNSDFRRLQSKLFDATPRQKKVGGRLDPLEQDRILSSCLASTILIDWDGLKSGGEPQPYDKQLATQMLSDPAFRRFRDAVVWASSVVAEEAGLNQEDDAGN